MFYRAEAYGFSAEFAELVEDLPVALERGSLTGRTLLEGRIVHIPDVQADPDYTFAEAQRLGGFRTMLGVPMLREDVPIGVLSLTRSEVRPFTDREIELVSTFADQAAIAIENVRLFDEIQDKSRQLELASQHKSQFLASMSHELRTPLNAIIGLTEMMVANAPRFGTEKAQEPLKRVHRAGAHLLGLINQVLDLSKIEAGKLELSPESVNLAPLIDEVVGTARQLAEQNKNRLVVECEDNLAPITVDPMRLRQILLNLLSNACKFTKQGEVALRVRKVIDGQKLGRACRVRYRHRHDAGAAGQAVRGIQPGRGHDRAALRRHRAGARHHPQARAHDGRRRHGDERSRAKARSSPSRLPGRADTPARERAAVQSSGSDCVLVIDDDATARELLGNHLKAEGFSVATAGGGLEGLKLAKELRPIAITLDVMMPDLDGWSVLAALRQDAELAEIPVIMVTILDEQRRGMALGAAGYLTKPIDRERLKRLVGPLPGVGAADAGPAGGRRSGSARARALMARRPAMGRAGGGERPRGTGALARGQAGPDPARPDDAGDGRLCRRRRLAEGARLAGYSGHRHHLARSRCQGPRAIEFRGAIGAGQGDVPAGRPGRAHPGAGTEGARSR